MRNTNTCAFKLITLTTLLSISWCLDQIESEVELIEIPKIHDFTSSRNKTYQIDRQVFAPEQKSYFIEMRLDEETQAEEMEIVFALSFTRALILNDKIKQLTADFIDVNGYQLRKRNFRIEIDHSELSSQAPIFLTIYQKGQIIRNLSYQIQFGIADDGKEKRCPFDCLGKGKCDVMTGKCTCFEGFFDHDCSRQATSMLSFKEQENNFIAWNQEYNTLNRIKFFYQDMTNLHGYLYLKLQKQEQNIQDNSTGIVVFYSIQQKVEKYNSNSKQQDFIKFSYFFSHQELIQGVDIFLESLEIPNQINNSDKFSPSSLPQQQFIIIGLMNYGDLKTAQYDLQLILKYIDINQEGLSKQIIIIMSIVLIVLIIFLAFLLIYLRNNIYSMESMEASIKSKKIKIEKELNEVIDLLPIFIYSTEIQQILSKDQDQSVNPEEDQPTCSVCLCEFEIGDSLRKTYCPHYFHSDCLASWIAKQKNCPHCRSVLTPRTLKLKQQPEIINESINYCVSSNQTMKYCQYVDESSIHSDPQLAISQKNIDTNQILGVSPVRMKRNNSKITNNTPVQMRQLSFSTKSTFSKKTVFTLNDATSILPQTLTSKANSPMKKSTHQKNDSSSIGMEVHTENFGNEEYRISNPLFPGFKEILDMQKPKIFGKFESYRSKIQTYIDDEKNQSYEPSVRVFQIHE